MVASLLNRGDIMKIKSYFKLKKYRQHHNKKFYTKYDPEINKTFSLINDYDFCYDVYFSKK